MKSIELLEMIEEADYTRRDFLRRTTLSLAAAETDGVGFTETRLSNATRTDTAKIMVES